MPEPFFLFDTHVHLDAEPLCGDAAVLEAARRQGVGGFIVPGVGRAGWPRLTELAASHPGVFAAPGLHPQAAEEWGEDAERELRRLAEDFRVAALGEIGLDGHLDIPVDLQEEAFRGQLRLAKAAGLPVLIHCRKATGRLLEILREERAQDIGGIYHAFTGSVETASQLVELGFALGFGGPLTWPNARRAPEALAAIPQEAVVLETDAPDMPPHPHRDGPNRPEYLPLIARKVAEIRGWSLEETARITTENARRVLRIEDRGVRREDRGQKIEDRR